VVREVAVRVDAVGDRDLVVAVVVAQVLAPQPLGIERVLVAVRVRHEHEPQLVVLQQAPDPVVVVAPLVDVPEHQPPVDLGRDPLARMLGRAVEHGRPAPVADAARALGQLHGEDLATLECRPEPHQLGELRVLAGDLVHLVADAARLVVRAPDVEAVGGLAGGELLDGMTAAHPRQRGGDALGRDLRALHVVEDQLDLEAVAGAALDLEVKAGLAQLAELLASDRRGVDVEPVASRDGSRRSKSN
jgi:hypothetical protein